MASFLVVARIESGFLAAKRMQKIVLWLMGYPARGVSVGGGIHVAMPATIPDPPPENGGYLGWTTRWRRWHRHPLNSGADTDRWALLVTPDLTAAWLAKRAVLPLAVRNWVQSHVDSAADLAADWFVAGELDSSEDILPEPTT